MMQRKILLFLSAACLAILPAFASFAQETAITSVPLTIYRDAVPRSGEPVGDVRAASDNGRFTVEGAVYLKKDDTWQYGDKPMAEIELSANEGYRFTAASRSAIRVSGCDAKYSSSELDDDGSTLIVTVSFPKIAGRLPATESAGWNGDKAVWDSVDGASSYEVRLLREGRVIASGTTAETAWDFEPNMNLSGTYTFSVQALGSGTSQSSAWYKTSEENVLTADDAWYKDNGAWKDVASHKRFVYEDGTYPTDTWRCLEDKWYYFDGSGYMVDNAYVKSAADDTYYWIGADGTWDGAGDTKQPNRAAYPVY